MEFDSFLPPYMDEVGDDIEPAIPESPLMSDPKATEPAPGPIMSDPKATEPAPRPLTADPKATEPPLVPLTADPKDTSQAPEPIMADPKETDPLKRSSPMGAIKESSKGWKLWDPERGLKPDEFRKIAGETLAKLSQATGDPALSSKEAIELLGLTAANETNLQRYMKAPGTSKQRGIMQLTDPTVKDLFRFMERDPNLQRVVESLRTPGIPISQDIESNIPLSIALARIRYMYSKSPIPTDPLGMAKHYKENYNTYHPKALASVKGALKNYKLFMTG